MWVSALRHSSIDLKYIMYEIDTNNCMPRLSYIERIIDELRLIVDYYKESESDV